MSPLAGTPKYMVVVIVKTETKDNMSYKYFLTKKEAKAFCKSITDKTRLYKISYELCPK